MKAGDTVIYMPMGSDAVVTSVNGDGTYDLKIGGVFNINVEHVTCDQIKTI